LAAVGAAVELDVIEGAGHFFEGRADVSAIFQRAVRFARTCVGAPLDDESWRGVPTT
jgi:hypothetical protein